MKSKFIAAIESAEKTKKTLTENGAVAYRSSGNKILDINFQVSSLRSAGDQAAIDMFKEAFYENPEYAIRWLFFARDVRGGMGERRLFRNCFKWLAENRPECVVNLIKLIPEYGRWDDLISIIGASKSAAFNAEIIDVIAKTLHKDLEAANAGKSISLLAKWLPSPTTSSPKTRELAKKVYRVLGMSEKEYRKTLSRLRKALEVVEVYISGNDWRLVEYSHVPSQANLKYSKAFLKHDAPRRNEFLLKAKKGEVKINSSASYPHDVMALIRKDVDTAEAMWKNLPDYVSRCDNGGTICVADTSGSMMCTIGNTSIRAYDVAKALAVYFSERMTGPYKDRMITFSEEPTYIDFSNAKSLKEKSDYYDSKAEIANTNIEAVMALILKTAVENKLEQKDLPNVLILSDMNFDQAIGLGWRSTVETAVKTLFETISEKYARYGYAIPRITFWNICGGDNRKGLVPLQSSENGISLIGGFSPSTVDMVYSSKFDPWEVLKDKLDSKRYEPVANAITLGD